MLFAAPRLPFTDLPEHIATTRILRDLVAGDAATSATYAANVLHSQYWLHHLVVALLAFVLGPTHANVALLVVTALAYPVSLGALLRAYGRDERLAIFGAMPFLSRSLIVGFLPFVSSVPVVLFGLALLERNIVAPRRARSVYLAVIAIVLFYLHVDAFAVFASVAFLRVVLAVFERENLGRSAKATLIRLAFFVPSTLVAAHWFLRGTLTAKTDTLGFPFIGKMSATRSALAIPLWMSDLWTDKIDDVACGLWWTMVVVLVIGGLAELRAVSGRALAIRYAPLFATLFLVFALPFRIGVASMLNVRVATFVAMFAILVVPAPRGRWGTVALAGVFVATLLQAGDAFANIRRLDRGTGADAAAILKVLPPKAKLLTLNFDNDADGSLFPPWLHVMAWHVADGGPIEGPSFVDLPHWSVNYRDGMGPPTRPLFWHPCQFRNAAEGSFYDDVVVVGARDPFASSPPGPVFRRVVQRGTLTLYERVPGESWPGDPATDPGPCPPPS